MTIRQRISLLISLNFTILFGIICAIVLYLFSSFRQQEFEERLIEKAASSIKLLVEVKGIDHDLMRAIDKHTINRLYDEKTLIFNESFDIIYSSLDDTKINWSNTDLIYLRNNGTFFRQEGDYEVYGIYYTSGNKKYYALVSANDASGKRKQLYLVYLLTGAYFVFSSLTWLLTVIIIKKELNPLIEFQRKIRAINEQNLDSPIEVNTNSKNEIELLKKDFNVMLTKIKLAYEKQKEFSFQVSHELRTPIARISAQIQNQLPNSNHQEKEFLKKMLLDVNQLNEVINSLLILIKLESQKTKQNEKCRIDEALYESIEKFNEQQIGNLKINLKINLDEEEYRFLEVYGNQLLLEIVFFNLLKNAYLYSQNQTCDVEINTANNQITVSFTNNGNLLSKEEGSSVFEPFLRGKNAAEKTGLGLGLRIVKRVLDSFNAHISYNSPNQLNRFTIYFQKN